MAKLKGRNEVFLTVVNDGKTVSHFKLREFENAEGLAMVHRSTLESLERVRADLGTLYGETVEVILTDAVRTAEDLKHIAAKYGWVEEGGAVARQSKHLTDYGGIAVDMIARVKRTKERVPQRTLGKICRQHFDFVKDDYADGHVHGDNRHRAD